MLSCKFPRFNIFCRKRVIFSYDCFQNKEKLHALVAIQIPSRVFLFLKCEQFGREKIHYGKWDDDDEFIYFFFLKLTSLLNEQDLESIDQLPMDRGMTVAHDDVRGIHSILGILRSERKFTYIGIGIIYICECSELFLQRSEFVLHIPHCVFAVPILLNELQQQ